MKPRVLLVNKFYYRRGGDCVVTLNLERLLRDNGHDVAVYAMTYPENIHSRYETAFASEVNFGGGMTDKLRATQRALGYGDIKRSFTSMLDSFKPDIVHLHNIHSYLSPVIAEIAHRRGIKVVWTLHDYKLICPTYSCLTPDGRVCERCLTDKKAVVTSRCHKGSLAASAIAWLEALKWNRRRLEHATEAFICPSGFMAKKMEHAGFDPSRLVVLNNFHDAGTQKVKTEREPFYLYAGRLAREKGIETLLTTAAELPDLRLFVAGDGPLSTELRHRYVHCSNIVFLGRIDGMQVSDYMSRARFTVIPSEWYENNPLGVIESLSAGTPVVGADMGGIPELLTGDNGIIFNHGDSNSLRHALSDAWNRQWDYAAIADDGRERFAPATHYRQLSAIYSGDKI